MGDMKCGNSNCVFCFGLKSKPKSSSWLTFDGQNYELPIVKENNNMPVFNVTITREFTKPQVDGSLLKVEQLVKHTQIVAKDTNTAGVIAGIDLELTAEDLSTASVRINQIM